MAVWTLVPDISLLELDALANDTELVPDLSMDVFSEKKIFLVKKFADSQYTYDYGCLEFTSAGVVDIVGTAGEFDDHRSYAIDSLRAMPWMLNNSFGVAMEFRLEDVSTRNYLFCQPIVNPASAESLWGIYIDIGGEVVIRRYTDGGAETIFSGMSVDPTVSIHNRLVVWYRNEPGAGRWRHTVYLNGMSGADNDSNHYQYIGSATHIYNAYVGYGYIGSTQIGFIGAIRQLKIYDCPTWTDSGCADMSATGVFPSKSLMMDFPLDNATNRVNVKYLQQNDGEVIFTMDQRMVFPVINPCPFTIAFKLFVQYDGVTNYSHVISLSDNAAIAIYHIYVRLDDPAHAHIYYYDNDGLGAETDVELGKVEYNEACFCILDLPDKNITSYVVNGRDPSAAEASTSLVKNLAYFLPVDYTYNLAFGSGVLGGAASSSGRVWDIITFKGTWTAEERAEYYSGGIPRYTEYYKMSDAIETTAGTTIASRNGIINSEPFTTPTISKPFSIGTLPAGCSYAPWLLHKGELVF